MVRASLPFVVAGEQAGKFDIGGRRGRDLAVKAGVLGCYAVLSSLVARRLQRNDEIEQARAAGVVLKGRDGRPRQAISRRTVNMTLDVISRIVADAVKRGLLQTNPASDPQLRLRVSQRRGNFLEADELLVVLEAAGTLDHPVSPQTLERATLVREMRAAGRTWKAMAAELEVAESTAIWLAGRTR